MPNQIPQQNAQLMAVLNELEAAINALHNAIKALSDFQSEVVKPVF